MVGEDIETPDGAGVVVGVTKWRDLGAQEKATKASWLKSQLGNGFVRSYFRVTVDLEDGRQTSYDCWEVSYDSERDPEDAPWREPRPDSEGGT